MTEEELQYRDRLTVLEYKVDTILKAMQYLSNAVRANLAVTQILKEELERTAKIAGSASVAAANAEAHFTPLA